MFKLEPRRPDSAPPLFLRPLGTLCPCIDFSELSLWLQDDQVEDNEDVPLLPEEKKETEEKDEAPPPIDKQMTRVLQEAFVRSQRASKIHGKSKSLAEAVNTRAKCPIRIISAHGRKREMVVTPGHRQVLSKVDCHMPEKTTLTIRKHEIDYVHKGVCAGQKSDIHHAISKVDDRKPKIDTREICESEHDYASARAERALDLDFKMVQLSRP